MSNDFVVRIGSRHAHCLYSEAPSPSSPLDGKRKKVPAFSAIAITNHIIAITTITANYMGR
eukprot:11191323-Lingulodinium_polyedra.AAC.1